MCVWDTAGGHNRPGSKRRCTHSQGSLGGGRRLCFSQITSRKEVRLPRPGWGSGSTGTTPVPVAVEAGGRGLCCTSPPFLGREGRAGLQGCQTHTAPGFSQGPRDLKSLRTAFVAGYVEFIPTKVHVLELNAPSCPSCCLLAGRCTAGLAAAPRRCPGAAGPARGHSGWQTGSEGPSATTQKSSRLKVPVRGCRRGQHPLPRAELPCHRSKRGQAPPNRIKPDLPQWNCGRPAPAS